MNLFWTAWRLDRLDKLRKRDVSYQAIAAELGTTATAARAAHKRHIAGRPDEADPEAVAQRSRDRAADFAAWERANNEKRNADKRRRRALAKAKASK